VTPPPTPTSDPGRDPLAGVVPHQIPGMARLLPLTPELWAHYADWPEPASEPEEPDGTAHD
jgi:hypothetical protein